MGCFSDSGVLLCLHNTASPSKGAVLYRSQFFAPTVFLGVYGAVLIKDGYFSMIANTFDSLKLDILCRSVDYSFVS